MRKEKIRFTCFLLASTCFFIVSIMNFMHKDTAPAITFLFLLLGISFLLLSTTHLKNIISAQLIIHFELGRQSPQRNRTDGWHRTASCPSCGYVPLSRYVWGYRGGSLYVVSHVLPGVSGEKGWLITMRGKVVGEFRSIVSLDTFNRAGKCLDQVFYKLRGRINAVFLKSFYKQR